MARFSDDAFATLTEELERDRARALGRVRQTTGRHRNAEIAAWLKAGDNLAEKAIAALDVGDDARATNLVTRLIALPVADDVTRSGLMAVSVILHNEVNRPLFEQGASADLLESPLRLLPTLDGPAADSLLRAVAALTDYDLPAATERRIRAIVPLERRLEEPFAAVPEAALPEAILAVLRLVIRLRTETARGASPRLPA